MFWLAFTFGLISSLHCLGMCGPLQAVVMGSWLNSKKRGNWLIYHSGRISTYIILALIATMLGASLGIPDLQGSFTIIAGLLLILGYFGFKSLSWDRKFLGLFQPILRKVQMKAHGKSAGFWYFTSGAMNGLLPCGMVYAALVPALSLANPVEGALYMLLFGLGTLPLLIGFNLFSNDLMIRFAPQLQKLIPISIILIGGLLILRGMELDIPYLSPPSPKPGASVEACS